MENKVCLSYIPAVVWHWKSPHKRTSRRTGRFYHSIYSVSKTLFMLFLDRSHHSASAVCSWLFIASINSLFEQAPSFTKYCAVNSLLKSYPDWLQSDVFRCIQFQEKLFFPFQNCIISKNVCGSAGAKEYRGMLFVDLDTIAQDESIYRRNLYK